MSINNAFGEHENANVGMVPALSQRSRGFIEEVISDVWAEGRVFLSVVVRPCGILRAFPEIPGCRLSLPVSVTYGSDYLVTLIQLVFAGRLGSTELVGVALGASFVNIAGFSILIGLLSALDTLSSQAYGARELKQIGIALQQSLFGLFVTCLLLFPLYMVNESYQIPTTII